MGVSALCPWVTGGTRDDVLLGVRCVPFGYTSHNRESERSDRNVILSPRSPIRKIHVVS